ncbi:MAG: class I SAM-dependent methyltransferase [Pirellulales bacterium]|nr:class I SAM-dependent methyltransferase [Pirellulales bacterium]
MLSRTLEPEVMDQPADAADYDAMDHRAVNERFVADLLAQVGAVGLLTGAEHSPAATSETPEWSPSAPTLDVIDLGTGTARIPILLCQQVPPARVLAVDAAVSMLHIAIRNIEIAGLRERIQLSQGDCKDLAYPDAMFDVVMSNSIVHHLAQPERLLKEALRLCRPDGTIFIRDLARPDTATRVDELVALYAAGCNAHQTALFRDSLHAALTLDEVREIVSSLGQDPAGVQLTSDRHWTWVGGK